MAYDPTKLVSLKNLKDTATRIKTEFLAAIAASGHAIFQKAAAVPTPETAQENILYLVKNNDTGYYDIYALVDGAVEWLDDLSVDLDDYVTSEELTQAIANLGAGAVYGGTKTSLETADSDVISAFFGEEDAPTPKEGDVFVVTTLVDGVTYEMSSYWYDGEGWVAITGNVDASKVIMRDNITMAGDYTQVGNKTKTQNGTAEFATKGMSVAAILTDIFSKRLQPTITAQCQRLQPERSQGRGGRHFAGVRRLHRRHPEPRFLSVRPGDRRCRHQLGGTGVHLHIVHAAQPGAVTDVDDFLVVHIRNSAKHRYPSFPFFIFASMDRYACGKRIMSIVLPRRSRPPPAGVDLPRLLLIRGGRRRRRRSLPAASPATAPSASRSSPR